MININNPGNIRISNTQWQGKISPSHDAQFETFDTPDNGIRAMAKILITYFDRGLNTIEAIITAWAPPSENDTDTYIDAVSDDSGFDSDQVLTLDASTLEALIPAIIKHENGKQPYDASLISTAIQEALT